MGLRNCRLKRKDYFSQACDVNVQYLLHHAYMAPPDCRFLSLALRFPRALGRKEYHDNNTKSTEETKLNQTSISCVTLTYLVVKICGGES